MTVIGRNSPGPQTAASPAAREEQRRSFRMSALLQSLADSLDLACRCYLCAPLVDCDPQTDPECGPSGKKLLIQEPVREVFGVVDRSRTPSKPDFRSSIRAGEIANEDVFRG